MPIDGGKPVAPARRARLDGAMPPRVLRWDRDGVTWPNRAASRFVEAGNLRWHVQVAGHGPALLLVHGTGASTHSWRDLSPMLTPHFTVVAPDLPGHAFTGSPPPHGMSLPGMAGALTALLRKLEIEPRLVAGHSAGAAVLARMCLDGAMAPAGLVSLNGALLPIGGMAGQVFSPLAKLLAAAPVVPRLFALWASDRKVVGRLMSQTGSTLDGAGLAFYARLARDPAHAAGALAMMANWDLRSLERALPHLPVPLVLVAGSRDGSIPPEDAFRLRDLVPGARLHMLRGLGHLAHEEQPGRVAELIVDAATKWGVLPPGPTRDRAVLSS